MVPPYYNKKSKFVYESMVHILHVPLGCNKKVLPSSSTTSCLFPILNFTLQSGIGQLLYFFPFEGCSLAKLIWEQFKVYGTFLKYYGEGQRLLTWLISGSFLLALVILLVIISKELKFVFAIVVTWQNPISH